MYENVFERKVDKQRRIALPSDWKFDSVFVFEGKDELHIIPKDKDSLRKMIDSVPVDFLPSDPHDLDKIVTIRKYRNLV